MDILLVAVLFLLVALLIGVGCAFIGVWLGRIFISVIGGLNADCIVYDRCDRVDRSMYIDGANGYLASDHRCGPAIWKA